MIQEEWFPVPTIENRVRAIWCTGDEVGGIDESPDAYLNHKAPEKRETADIHVVADALEAAGLLDRDPAWDPHAPRGPYRKKTGTHD